MINFVAFVTPAGTCDEGGVEPAYINFDAELLAPPICALKVHLSPWHMPEASHRSLFYSAAASATMRDESLGSSLPASSGLRVNLQYWH